jgi:hypothetical protein
MGDAAMQIEVPRHVPPDEQAGSYLGAADFAARGQGDGTSAAEDAAALGMTDDELALIDLRYRHFLAQAELDQLMEEL